MRWALTSSFEHSNRELLALSVCRDTTVFVVHKGSHRGPIGVLWGCPGVPRGPRGVAGRPRGDLGVPGACRASQVHPQGSQGRAQGIPGILGRSMDVVQGIPGILFIKMIA